MFRQLMLASFGVFWLLASMAWSQTAAAGQDFTFTVTTSQPWTDTGLDLLTGDSVQISANGAALSGCDPEGISGASSASVLPLPLTAVGALIARLHAHGGSPLPVASGTELRIEEPSHLFLGVNASGAPPCAGAFSVKVHRVPASSSISSASGSNSRSEQLKAQLGTAAEIFLQGQFGTSKSSPSPNEENSVSGGSSVSGESSDEHPTGTESDKATEVAPVLRISGAALAPALRKDLERLPRRVNDEFQNLGDMVNFVILGSQQSVQAALDAGSWHVADTTKKKAVLTALMETYEDKDYLQMPMSSLYLFGRCQDFGYEMAEPIAMVASRHHFRIWKAPFTWNGREVWVGAGTHDVGFARDKRNGSVTHKIDPLVDGERSNIGGSLQKANKVKSLTYYLPSDPVQAARNATGDGYQSDGRLLVIMLQ